MTDFKPNDRVVVTWTTGTPIQPTRNQARATVVDVAHGTGPFNNEPEDGFTVRFDHTPDENVFVPTHHLTPAGDDTDGSTR
jgi:hypothetical protein